jgi:hypothetical protein
MVSIKKIGTLQKIDSYICLTFGGWALQQSNLSFKRAGFTVKPNFKCYNFDSNIERESHFFFIRRLSEKGIDVSLLDAFKELSIWLRLLGRALKELGWRCTKQFSNISYLGNLSSGSSRDRIAKKHRP